MKIFLKKIDYYLQKSRVCRALPSVDFLKGAITEELESRTGTNGGENPALGTLDAHTWFITHLLLPFAFLKTKLCAACFSALRLLLEFEKGENIQTLIGFYSID